MFVCPWSGFSNLGRDFNLDIDLDDFHESSYLSWLLHIMWSIQRTYITYLMGS